MLSNTAAASEKSAALRGTSGALITLSGSGEKVTPQEALLQTMAAMHQKVGSQASLSLWW